MKNPLYRSFTFLMALLLLASTTSWTVGKHYCMGLLMDVSLFEHAESCGMDMTAEQNADSCCDDEIFAMTGQDTLKISFNDFDVEQQLFLVVFTTSYPTIIRTTVEPWVPGEYYPTASFGQGHPVA